MTDRIVTYQSRNSRPEKAWLAYIETDAGRLNIIFDASTEDEVKAKVREFWAKDREEREANRRKKEEQRAAKEARKAGRDS